MSISIGLAKISSYIHVTSSEAADAMMEALRRKTYTTPTSFLELMKIFLEVYGKQKDKLSTRLNRYKIGGEDEASSKANASIGAKMPIGAGIILLLLVTQFNSFRKTAIVLLTVPLGLAGVVLGLLVARSYFGFMTLLGVISLFGIVINNAIVLLDRIQIELDENGRSPADAILVASETRLRPILLTTATTILGLIPLYLGGGPMWEPMAVAIMAGLAFSTVLTLGVVPVLYATFYGVALAPRSE